MDDKKRSYYNAQGKLVLPQVTLCAMDSVQVRATLKAMEYSMKDIVFADAVIITDKKPLFMPKGIRYAHIDKLCNIDDFNYKTVYDLGDYIKTEFALLVHYDGFVVHPEMWRDEFLEYDYIGSPWPLPKPGFHCADCLFLLIQYKKNIHHLFVSGRLVGCVYIHNF